MSLFLVTLLTGIALIAFGGHFLWHGMRSERSAKAFPRSQNAAYLLFGSAAVWFLYYVTQLGPADFGQYKHLLFVLFLGTAVGAFYFVPDFLAVRGLAALILLTAGLLLEASFMHYGAALILKAFVYAAIVVALIIGASPYLLRDFIGWLYKSNGRPRIFGGIFTVYGLVLVGTSFIF
jgi:hypothetical protein